MRTISRMAIFEPTGEKVLFSFHLGHEVKDDASNIFSIDGDLALTEAEFKKRAARLRLRTKMDELKRRQVGLRDQRGMNAHYLRVKYLRKAQGYDVSDWRLF